jgi:hypothetical protein
MMVERLPSLERLRVSYPAYKPARPRNGPVA